jgi:hypothetical protein
VAKTASRSTLWWALLWVPVAVVLLFPGIVNSTFIAFFGE